MGLGTRLIACPSCSCHAFAHEQVCPKCGSALRASDGTIPRTAGAVMLGLTLATTSIAACSDDTKTGSGGNGGNGGDMIGSTTISAYGVASTTGEPPTSSGGGFGGAGGTGGTGGMGGASGGAGGTGGK